MYNIRLIANWQNAVCLQAQYERIIASYYRTRI